MATHFVLCTDQSITFSPFIFSACGGFRHDFVTWYLTEPYRTAPHAALMQAATPEAVQVGRIDHGDFVGGECLFIPSKPDDGVASLVGEEDDGFLVSFVSPRDGGNSGTYGSANRPYDNTLQRFLPLG